MVMYDRHTFTWWQHALGQGIIAELTGVEFTVCRSCMESFADFKARNPTGIVMEEPKYFHPYGKTPFAALTIARVRFCSVVDFRPRYRTLGNCGAYGKSRLAAEPIFRWGQTDQRGRCHPDMGRRAGLSPRSDIHRDQS